MPTAIPKRWPVDAPGQASAFTTTHTPSIALHRDRKIDKSGLYEDVAAMVEKAQGEFSNPPAEEPILKRQSIISPVPLRLEEAIDKVSCVYRALNLKAANASSVPIRVMRKQKDGTAEIDNETPVARKLLRLLVRPNAHMSGSDFVGGAMHWLNAREALIWKYYGVDKNNKATTPKKKPGPPEALYFLPAQRTVRWMKGGTIDHYNVSGGVMEIPASQVCRIGFYNAKDEFRALSPLEACFQSADTDYASELFSSNFFDRGAMFSGIVGAKNKVGTDAAARYKTLFDQMGGVGNAGQIAFIDNDVTFSQTTPSFKDIGLGDLVQVTKSKIAMAFGVPLVMLGEPDKGGKLSTEELRKSFWQDTLLPEMRMITDKLNVDLVPLYGDENIFLEFDFSQVEALSDDRLDFAQSFMAVAQGIGFLATAGLIQPEDVQTLLKDRFGIEMADPLTDDEEIETESMRKLMAAMTAMIGKRKRRVQ